MSETEKSATGANPGGESLPSLIGRLGEDIVTLLDTKLGLLKIEIKEDVTAYVCGRVSIGVGGMIAARIDQIKYSVLERNGSISIIPKQRSG